MTFWTASSPRARVGAVALLLCPLALPAQRQNGLLVGRVLSGDVAVPGAAIFVSGGRVTLARVDGRFQLSLPAGRYEVRAQRIGYSSARDTITVAGGQTATANFRLDHALSMLESVASVGSRGYERTVMETPSPVDVLSGVDLRGTGQVQTSRMLQAMAPSINAPRATFAEGSDLIHPVTMRGLGPDQVLVLVNGRRRHSSALLNVNTTTGRGSTGVDLDAIPASMIDHVEVLRDGAAAQYGPEAVAGVINVVLKSGVHGDAATTVGGNATTYNRADDIAATYPVGERDTRDGRTVQASIDKGIVFGERGFLHGDLEVRSRDFSNRALPDPRVQYAPGDPRAAQTGVSQDLVTNRVGDATSHDAALYLNGGNRLASGMEIYGNVGGSQRTMDAAGVFRRAADLSTNSSAYPNGFLPVIHPTVQDYAGTLGLRGALDEWRWDLSSTYGRNTVGYDVLTTQDGAGNAGASFDAGRVKYGQSTTNFDLSRTLDFFEEVRVATGAELRGESYGIAGGTGPVNIVGFAGFGPAQVVDRSRSNVAGYADVETDLTQQLMLGVAGRVEHFSDVGTLGDARLSLRFAPVQKLALRGSLSSSRRAPSLAQSYYSNFLTDPGTSGNVWNVVRVDDPAAVAAGATALRPERAMTISAGFASEITPALSLSADLYRITVADRVVLLQSLSDAPPPVSQFSSNAADTRTQGIDVSATYALRLDDHGTLHLTGGANVGSTTVTAARSVNGMGLGRVGVTRLERGQPNSNILASASYQLGSFGAMLRTQRFGEVTTAGAQGSTALDQTFAARWITDASISSTLLRKYTLTAGVNNLLDVYPDRNNVPGTSVVPGNGFFGIQPYSSASPFGFNGRYVFGKLSIYL